MNFLKNIVVLALKLADLALDVVKVWLLLFLLLAPIWRLANGSFEDYFWVPYIFLLGELFVLGMFFSKYDNASGIQYQNRDIYLKYRRYFLIFCIVVNWGTYFVYRERIPRTIEENLLKMITFF